MGMWVGEVDITSPQPLLYVQPDSVTKVENWRFQHFCKSLCKRLCSLEVVSLSATAGESEAGKHAF